MASISESSAVLTTKPLLVDERSDTTKTNMIEKLTQLGHTFRRQRQCGTRRRATILVLVMAVLGLLFVAGVAFMATMNFEASIISSERRRNQAAPAMQQVMQDTSNLISDLVEPLSGAASGSSVADGAAAYVQLPGVHNLTAPIEPYRDNTSGRMFWPWVTDLEAIQSQSFIGSDFKMSRPGDPILMEEERLFALDVLGKPGYEALIGERGGVVDANDDGFADPPLLPLRRILVDADGDGIVDAIEVNLATAAGGNKLRLAGLARILNPASKPMGTVKLGLRVVSHNGMVNVNASHPLLISNILGSLNHLDPPYAPTIEEPSLRRRHFLPPEILSLTRLQGSRFSPDLATGDGHYATALFPDRESPRDHRYWPFSPNEMGKDPDFPLWWLRMDADKADPDPTRDEYDRRHLVTTISHSDLLRRPALVGQSNNRKDLIDLVIENSRASLYSPNNPVDRFPLLAYPFSDTTELNATITCVSDPNCTLDPRKGRLKLSLAWLDQASDPTTGYIPSTLRTLLIQDAFTLLLFNARGSAWGVYQNADPLDPNNERTIWVPDYDVIARTAASLTANMIDFADTDDFPTAVAIRSADPNDPEFGFPLPSGEEVFGLEIQPFIVEVIANASRQDDADADGQLDEVEYITGSNSFYGVELFNPFAKKIVLNGYSIIVAGNKIDFKQNEELAPGEIKGFYTDGSTLPINAGNTSTFKAGTDTFFFEEGDTITLVLATSGTSVVDVVVDRFTTGSGVGDLGGGLKSLQRAADDTDIGRWHAPVPLDNGNLQLALTATFGDYNYGPSEGAPVELIFPDTPDGTLSTVFPTTGMLLTLMRHANSTSKAFTEKLNNIDELDVGGNTPTDNGRMPIYDESVANTTGYHAHHIDPNWDMTRMTIPVGSGLPTVGVEGTTGKAGGAMHLPWGQLVFDYFTAMPLDGPGPYTHHDNGNLDTNEDAPPKVDMGGLRVHGQIDLNTAPWKVLEGLPFVAMDQIPVPFQDKFDDILGLSPDVDITNTGRIGEFLAKAIVAYRELRVLESNMITDTTEDYAATGLSVSRGWSDTAPSMRRGTGFVSVGELANVRHPNALFEYRTDSSEFNSAVEFRSYIESIAVLASLGEWLTVRPHVFTVYGTLRGEEDLTITDPADPDNPDMRVKDVSSRALRFQETVDRLPAILGEPVRTVGPQVIGKYHDTRGD